MKRNKVNQLMARFKVGDKVKDINPTWPNYGCTGVVTSVRGNNITWKHDGNGQLITDKSKDLTKIKTKRRIRQLKNKSTTFTISDLPQEILDNIDNRYLHHIYPHHNY